MNAMNMPNLAGKTVGIVCSPLSSEEFDLARQDANIVLGECVDVPPWADVCIDLNGNSAFFDGVAESVICITGQPSDDPRLHYLDAYYVPVNVEGGQVECRNNVCAALEFAKQAGAKHLVLAGLPSLLPLSSELQAVHQAAIEQLCQSLESVGVVIEYVS